IAREVGSASGIAESLYDLGLVARDRGEASRDRTLWSESLAVYQELGNKQRIADCLEDSRAWRHSRIRPNPAGAVVAAAGHAKRAKGQTARCRPHGCSARPPSCEKRPTLPSPPGTGRNTSARSPPRVLCSTQPRSPPRGRRV